MPIHLANPKVSVTLDMARTMKIEIETNPGKHIPFVENHLYIDIFVVWGREVGDPPVFFEQMDPETSAIAQYYRITDGFNPHARPALPGADPRGDPPHLLGRCDNAACEAWQDRGLEALCPDCEVGTVQPYDGFSRAAVLWVPGLQEFFKMAVVAFAQEPGAQDAFAAGGATLEAAIDAFMMTPAFAGYVMQNGLFLSETISEGVYGFLCNEVVPDPVDGVPRALLEAA